jgi:hypothetical protein
MIHLQAKTTCVPTTSEIDCSQDGVTDEKSLVKTRTNTCLSETSGVPSYSVVWCWP